MNQDYKDYIANEVRKNQFKMIQNQPQAESLATLESPRMYGGKRVRDHPLAGYTAYSEEPSTLTVPGPTLLNRTYNTNFKQLEGAGRLTNAIKQRILSQHPELMEEHLSGGKIDWNNIWNNIKKGASFVSKAAPIVSSLAPEEYRDTINKTGDISGKISGMGRKKVGRPKKHYTHHDIRMVEPVERHHKLDGAGFWKDFGTGFKSGFKGANKVASKILPIASIFQPELAPLAAASIAANKAMGGVRRRKCKGGSSELYPPAVMKGGARTARGALIKQIMNKYKCTLGEASKHIKENNLM
jgi:hypothetical protein